jgi:hypothetical protein
METVTVTRGINRLMYPPRLRLATNFWHNLRSSVASPAPHQLFTAKVWQLVLKSSFVQVYGITPDDLRDRAGSEPPAIIRIN